MLEQMKMLTGTGQPVTPADMPTIAATMFTGLAVVFLILIILVFILFLMGKILGRQKKEKTPEIHAPAAAAPQPIPVPVIEEMEDDDDELIAVITAAVAAYGEAEGKQYTVTGIRRKDKRPLRSAWGSAGVAEGTRPFLDAKKEGF